MLVLGIDAATLVAGVAVLQEDKVIAEQFVNNKLTHSQNLMPMIDQALKDAGLSPDRLEGLAVSIGPGSFTGLRIGLATAKGLAQALGIPLVGVPTLDVLAFNLAGVPGLICPILDAKKQQVYTALYQSSPSPRDCPQRLTDYLALRLEQLVEMVKGYAQPVTFLGDGVPTYGQDLAGQIGNRCFFASAINTLPRGSSVARLGIELLKKGQGQEWLLLEPAYIRQSEAEVTWAKKNGCQLGE